MSIDVLPDPVGPIMRLKAPFLKISSLSMWRRNDCLDGVRVPSDGSLDHEYVDLPKPISSECSADESAITESADSSVYASSSSVYITC